MATKATVTKESKSHTAKGTVPSPEPKKSGVTKKDGATAPEKAPVAAAKSAKTDSTVKPLPATVILESAQDNEPTTAAKTDKRDVTKKQPVVEPAVPQAALTAAPDQKWQEIRLILEKLKEETLREIRKSVKNGTEAVAAIEPGGDIYDQASSERDRELGLLLGDREREKIHSIDEALLRIDDGDYGICEECDEDIPLGRLKAMPFTRHCVKCKSELEKLQAQTKRVEEERAYREIPLGAEEDES